MEDMASLWGFDEELNNVEPLGHILLLTSLELGRLKAEANEKSRKNKELIHLLKLVIMERDEAKNQLQNLLSNKAISLTSIAEKDRPAIPHFPGNSPLVKPGNANSSVAESKNLSETHNCHSYGSSSVDSLAVVAPFIQESSAVISNNVNVAVKFDRYSLVRDNLLRGKSLPQQGKLLQTVLEAGPLLQTIFVSGPVPRWQNPPQL